MYLFRYGTALAESCDKYNSQPLYQYISAGMIYTVIYLLTILVAYMAPVHFLACVAKREIWPTSHWLKSNTQSHE